MKDIVMLTGEPVSEQTKDVLARLSAGQDVSQNEIDALPEMQAARSHITHMPDTLGQFGRDGMRIGIAKEIFNEGSAVFDENGKVSYNGDVEQGKRLDVVIGLPASGKSSAVVDKISAECHSRVIDNDDAKQKIPEFNDGWGAGVVHEESAFIADRVFESALKLGDNIVLPKVGSNATKLMDNYINKAKEFGYTVNVSFVDLNPNKAMGRMIGRFLEEGRFIDPKIVDSYVTREGENKIEKAYEELKEDHRVDGFSKWDNDVARGEDPILVETHNMPDDFIEKAQEKIDKEDKDYGHIKDTTAIDGRDNRESRGSVDREDAKIYGESQTAGRIISGRGSGENDYRQGALLNDNTEEIDIGDAGYTPTAEDYEEAVKAVEAENNKQSDTAANDGNDNVSNDSNDSSANDDNGGNTTNDNNDDTEAKQGAQPVDNNQTDNAEKPQNPDSTGNQDNAEKPQNPDVQDNTESSNNNDYWNDNNDPVVK